MTKIIMYSTHICPYCLAAERLLRSKGVKDIEKIMVDREPRKRTEMTEKTGRRTVPQIFINTQYVGGYDELKALNHAGALDKLLALPS